MADYTVLSTVPLNYYDRDLQEAYPAHQVTARWTRTGGIIRVTIPDTSYNPTNVDAAIRTAGANEDQIAALGTSPAAPPPPAKG